MPAILRRLRALRVVHPFPSLVNAALVALIAATAGGQPLQIVLLVGAMLGMQFCIGATNDVLDLDADRSAKPWKPIPAKLVGVGTAKLVAALSGTAGLALALLAGPIEAALWVAMLGCGLAYNYRLKPTPWAWVCFSIAFALLPIYAWYGAASASPPQWPLVVLIAFLAGPALQIANGLIDLQDDATAGLDTLTVRLGRTRSLMLDAVLLVLIHGLAWLFLSPIAPPAVWPLLAMASVLAASGLWLSSGASAARQAGWTIQVLSISALAAAWLLSVG